MTHLRKKTMSERIHELLLRNLLEVFGEGDSAKRRSAIEELYTDDCVVYVPYFVSFPRYLAYDAQTEKRCAIWPRWLHCPNLRGRSLWIGSGYCSLTSK